MGRSCRTGFFFFSLPKQPIHQLPAGLYWPGSSQTCTAINATHHGSSSLFKCRRRRGVHVSQRGQGECSFRRTGRLLHMVENTVVVGDQIFPDLRYKPDVPVGRVIILGMGFIKITLQTVPYPARKLQITQKNSPALLQNVPTSVLRRRYSVSFGRMFAFRSRLTNAGRQFRRADKAPPPVYNLLLPPSTSDACARKRKPENTIPVYQSPHLFLFPI